MPTENQWSLFLSLCHAVWLFFTYLFFKYLFISITYLHPASSFRKIASLKSLKSFVLVDLEGGAQRAVVIVELDTCNAYQLLLPGGDIFETDYSW